MHASHVSFFAGLLIGFSVAIPIGPMAIVCIRRTLGSGMLAGVMTGLGAATINVLFGALIILGVDELAPLMASFGHVLSLAGGIYLLRSAALAFRCQPVILPESTGIVTSPLAAYGSALVFNATNPMSPVLIIALITPLLGTTAPSPTEAIALLSGMFVAAATWWVCLSYGVNLVRSRVSAKMLFMFNQAAGVLLTIYGALALARSAGL